MSSTASASIPSQEPSRPALGDALTPAFWVALLALGASLLALTLVLRTPAPTTYATIDLNAIVALKEKEFTTLLSKPDVSDAQREQAYELVKAIGPQIEAGIKALHQSCKCVILTRGAVLSGDEAAMPDLTAVLKAKLGI